LDQDYGFGNMGNAQSLVLINRSSNDIQKFTEIGHAKLLQELYLYNTNECTTIYNDNHACVVWSAWVTNKGTKRMNLKENYVREARHLGFAKITHIPGVFHTCNLFTKKLKDTAQFSCCDAMMGSKMWACVAHIQTYRINTPSPLLSMVSPPTASRPDPLSGCFWEPEHSHLA